MIFIKVIKCKINDLFSDNSHQNHNLKNSVYTLLRLFQKSYLYLTPPHSALITCRLLW